MTDSVPFFSALLIFFRLIFLKLTDSCPVAWWYSIVCLLFRISPEEYSAFDFRVGPALKVFTSIFNLLIVKGFKTWDLPKEWVGLSFTYNADCHYWRIHMHIEFGANQKSHCRRKPGVGLQHLRRLLFNDKGTAKKFLDVGCEYMIWVCPFWYSARVMCYPANEANCGMGCRGWQIPWDVGYPLLGVALGRFVGIRQGQSGERPPLVKRWNYCNNSWLTIAMV